MLNFQTCYLFVQAHFHPTLQIFTLVLQISASTVIWSFKVSQQVVYWQWCFKEIIFSHFNLLKPVSMLPQVSQSIPLISWFIKSTRREKLLTSLKGCGITIARCSQCVRMIIWIYIVVIVVHLQVYGLVPSQGIMSSWGVQIWCTLIHKKVNWLLMRGLQRVYNVRVCKRWWL